MSKIGKGIVRDNSFGVCCFGRRRETGSVGRHFTGSDGDCLEKADCAMCCGAEK